MKPTLLTLLIVMALTASCRRHQPICKNKTVTPPFITADSANKMLGSYLNSINYANNDTSIRSLLLDMDAIRAYTDQPGKQVKVLKIMFAHTLDYINSGHGDQPAGYRSGAFTIILAGLDSNNDYVFFNDNGVIDHGRPCPSNCALGEGASNLLPTNVAQ